MPSDPDRVLDWIGDILEHVERIRGAVRGLSRDAFLADWQVRYAVQHALLIVSEASRRLPEGMLKRHPEVPWRNVRDLRNFYSHAYQHIDPRSVWETATTMLDVLEAALLSERDRLRR